MREGLSGWRMRSGRCKTWAAPCRSGPRLQMCIRDRPTLVTAGFMGMAALLLLVCGLILDTQGKTSRQQYELQMNAMQMLYDLGRQERQGEAEGKKAS